MAQGRPRPCSGHGCAGVAPGAWIPAQDRCQPCLAHRRRRCLRGGDAASSNQQEWHGLEGSLVPRPVPCLRPAMKRARQTLLMGIHPIGSWCRDGGVPARLEGVKNGNGRSGGESGWVHDSCHAGAFAACPEDCPWPAWQECRVILRATTVCMPALAPRTRWPASFASQHVVHSLGGALEGNVAGCRHSFSRGPKGGRA